MLSGQCDDTFLAGQNTLPDSRHHYWGPSGSEDISKVWLRSWHGFLCRGRKKDWVFSCLTKTEITVSIAVVQHSRPLSLVL